MAILARIAFGLLLAWAVITLPLIWMARVWIRERYGRGGPFPASAANALLNPLRRRIHPAREMLERFGLGPGQTALELGPGPGYFTIEASRLTGEGGRVICLDIQPGMIARLRERLAEANVQNARLMVGDATKLPLKDGCVDTAFLVTVLGEVPDRLAALAELRRVMKPGGVLSFAETLTDPDYMLKDTLRDLCRARGFAYVDEHGHFLGYSMRFAAASEATASAGSQAAAAR